MLSYHGQVSGSRRWFGRGERPFALLVSSLALAWERDRERVYHKKG